MRGLTQDGEVFSHDLAPFASAQEALTGVAVIPVSVIGPLDIELGEYELEEPFGRLAETGRARDKVYVPLAHTEGGLSASLYRGARAVAVGRNMRTRNWYAFNLGYVMEEAPVKPQRAILEANMGGDKKPSHRYFERGGHGKTVIAETTLTHEAVRRVLRTSVDDLLELSWAGTHGAVASGMQSVAFPPASAIAAIFAATGQGLGMVGTSSMAHGTGKRVEGGLNCTIRLAGLEVGTVGGGTTLPYARSWLSLMGCAGAGKVYRFAQIVAAATLALEISASAAMATAGSQEFFKAHHERGGLRPS